ncbi:MAG: hypothetical protein FJW40_17315 [Acidobacteria bacterium]|nr:hypothetical protein [Acidobacteriota bacterium]
MTVNVNIRPELEARLTAHALSVGESLESFIQRLLESEAAKEATGSRVPSGREKAEAFEAWTKTFPPDMPVLSTEDVSREKMYERD